MSSPDADVVPPDEVFPPTLREVMLRPRWIGVLALCLVIAGVFAWLGQWQLGRALQSNPIPPGATEVVQPLADVAAPGEYVPEPLVGQRVTATGTWIPGDFIVVSSRFNDGAEGYWVTGQFRIAEEVPAQPVSVAVAIGWVPTREEALAAAAELEEQARAAGSDDAPLAITGRLISDEGPVPPSRAGDPLELTRMSPAALLSRWHDVAGLDVYRAYIAAEVPLAGLQAISSPAPADAPLNWLNIFYALEWAVFAGFAFYLWYRLARDAWEKEVEDLEDAQAAAEDAQARG
ncbi:SURF1 family cytochrome oxidase biogenesis protein [Microbacterium sp. NPDC064584]